MDRHRRRVLPFGGGVPHLIEELRTGEHLSRIGRQEGKQVELTTGQVTLGSGYLDVA